MFLGGVGLGLHALNVPRGPTFVLGVAAGTTAVGERLLETPDAKSCYRWCDGGTRDGSRLGHNMFTAFKWRALKNVARYDSSRVCRIRRGLPT